MPARGRGLIGPLTVVAGIVWAILQPYRITLLHPRGEGFWFLFVQPPLWVIAAGVVFAVFVARPLVADLEAEEEARVTPPSETVHWMFATGMLFLGLLKLAEVIAGAGRLAPAAVAALPLARARCSGSASGCGR